MLVNCRYNLLNLVSGLHSCSLPITNIYVYTLFAVTKLHYSTLGLLTSTIILVVVYGFLSYSTKVHVLLGGKSFISFKIHPTIWD